MFVHLIGGRRATELHRDPPEILDQCRSIGSLCIRSISRNEASNTERVGPRLERADSGRPVVLAVIVVVVDSRWVTQIKGDALDVGGDRLGRDVLVVGIEGRLTKRVVPRAELGVVRLCGVAAVVVHLLAGRRRVEIGGEVGLRSFEVPQIQPRHVRRTDDGDYYRLRVPREKDTSGNGGKPRNAYLPRDVETAIHQYARDEPLIDLTERSVQRAVKGVARAVAETTGEPDFRKVSSHDLHRYYANQLLVEEQMNPRVVMKVGGWDRFESIEPYFSHPTEGTVTEAFSAIGMD